MAIQLRKALPDEADALTDLALRSKRAWGYDQTFMARVMPDMIVRPEYLSAEHGIVAEDDGVIVGYAIVRIDGKAAFLRDLFVEPARFRKGFGRALFQEAARFAQTHGATTLTLVGDPNAVGFYQRMGMSLAGSEPSIAGRGRMLPVMELRLSTDATSRVAASDSRPDDSGR